jgi:hypothetical protein
MRSLGEDGITRDIGKEGIFPCESRDTEDASSLLASCGVDNEEVATAAVDSLTKD